jgi:hypothetical protein
MVRDRIVRAGIFADPENGCDDAFVPRVLNVRVTGRLVTLRIRFDLEKNALP